MELTPAALFIRSLTVATHRKNILRKIQACSLIKLISLSNRSRWQLKKGGFKKYSFN